MKSGRPIKCVECPTRKLGATKCEVCESSRVVEIGGEMTLVCFESGCHLFKKYYESKRLP